MTSFRSSTKIGRKGDPRMHRAVCARIANPKLNLFEALKIGGFEYPSDDDPFFMDSGLVTLGQRKNQLCRRIRIALRQCNEKNLYSDRKCCKNSKTRSNKPFSHPLNERFQLIPDGNSIGQSRLKPESQQDACSKLRTTEAIPKFMQTYKNDTNHHLECRPCLEPRRESGTPDAAICTDESCHLAVDSLKQTAASMGMTLDQLALSFANCNDSVPSLNYKSRHDHAVALYQYESRVVLQKAMLLAGYSPQIAQNDESPFYMQVALSTWKREGQRIQECITKIRGNGRMPVLHHPVGHTPHVDFLVDDRVECYFGTDLNEDCTLTNLQDETGKIMDFAFCDEPRVYDKNDTDFNQDIDFDSNEWLLSFFSSTESTQNQATFLNGKMKDTTYHCSDTNAWDTDMISCLEAV